MFETNELDPPLMLESPDQHEAEHLDDTRDIVTAAESNTHTSESVANEAVTSHMKTSLAQAVLNNESHRQTMQLADPPTTPAEALAWMNVAHFVVKEGGKTVVITEEDDPEVKRRVLKRSSFNDVRNYYCNRRVWVVDDGTTRDVPLGHYWLSHPERRQYLGITFAPNGGPFNYYNLWQGFSVGAQQGDWSLMEAHVLENICAGNPELFAYVRKWLAFAVQQPETLPEVALVMRGKQGTGKGVFARGFGALFGQHFLHLARKHNLVGNFNSHLRDAIVVFADEAFLADDKQTEGVLKAMITEPEQTIERKHQDVVT